MLSSGGIPVGAHEQASVPRSETEGSSAFPESFASSVRGMTPPRGVSSDVEEGGLPLLSLSRVEDPPLPLVEESTEGEGVCSVLSSSQPCI